MKSARHADRPSRAQRLRAPALALALLAGCLLGSLAVPSGGASVDAAAGTPDAPRAQATPGAQPAPATPGAGRDRTRVSLNGPWLFAIDYTNTGEADRWFAPDLAEASWDKVDVPHCWPVDPRFVYTGTAWYRRVFDAPADLAGKHARIEFDAVFSRARVWLNGQLLGSHEGGYTPFGFDVTTQITPGARNVLVVAADNSWSMKTMPGARPGDNPNRRVYPWWDYGGIVRPVSLVVSSPVYVTNQRIIATPDLAAGTATIDATVWIRNTTSAPVTPRVSLALARLEGDREQAVAPTAADALHGSASIPAGETKSVTLRATLPREAVRLWNLDRPALYLARAQLAGASAPDSLSSTFGIRRFEVRGAQLLLNGRPVRLGGANRPNDHPRFGLIEPKEVVEEDLRMMKAAGMELQRMIHYALPATLLDVADRMGMLLIAEAGNWQLQPSQMDDEGMRTDFRNQMREMMERDWNHPSVVAWSVGNEYPSDTPAGVRWTRDMAAYVRTLDTSRPVTFASYRAQRDELQRPEDEGSHYVDFVSVNLYDQPANLAKRLDLIHTRWPDKPVFITEFGRRADKVDDEQQREQYFREAIEVVRARPFVAGASVWTFNDYRSRFPDTAPNGYRPWGLVDQDRKPRAAFDTVSREFAAVRTVGDLRIQRARDGIIAHVTVEARGDFPSRDVVGLTVRVSSGAGEGDASPSRAGGGTAMPVRASAEARDRVPDLAPGQRASVAVRLPGVTAHGGLTIELLGADGRVLDRHVVIDVLTPTSAPGAKSSTDDGSLEKRQ